MSATHLREIAPRIVTCPVIVSPPEHEVFWAATTVDLQVTPPLHSEEYQHALEYFLMHYAHPSELFRTIGMLEYSEPGEPAVVPAEVEIAIREHVYHWTNLEYQYHARSPLGRMRALQIGDQLPNLPFLVVADGLQTLEIDQLPNILVFPTDLDCSFAGQVDDGSPELLEQLRDYRLFGTPSHQEDGISGVYFDIHDYVYLAMYHHRVNPRSIWFAIYCRVPSRSKSARSVVNSAASDH